MPDPRAVHDAEQAVAAFRTIAGALATAYAELIASKVPPEHAVRITCAMASAVARPQPREDQP
jgi:hypothetical protein